MTNCKNCNTEIDQTITVCQVCKYPIEGTDQEKAQFIAKQVIQKSNVEYSIKRLKHARNTLLAVGAYFLLGAIIHFTKEEQLKGIIGISFGLGFFSLAFLTIKKPILAISIPLGLTLAYYLFLLITNPLALWVGFVWKIAVLTGLGYGLYSVLKANKTLRENPYLASVLGFSKI